MARHRALDDTGCGTTVIGASGVNLPFILRILALSCALLAGAGCVLTPGAGAYRHALVHGEDPARGVILFLHGCRGLEEGRLYRWQQDWADHLTANGYVVVVPDSFAEPRPPASCAAPYPRKAEIHRLRARQAVHALDRIAEAYPRARVFVWGHSEGAGVANLLDRRVHGIITTGYQCGYRASRRTDVPVYVPLLAVMGTDDAYVREAVGYAGAGSAEEICRALFRPPAWRYVIVEGMGHAAPMSEPGAREAIERFLGLAPAAPSTSGADGIGYEGFRMVAGVRP